MSSAEQFFSSDRQQKSMQDFEKFIGDRPLDCEEFFRHAVVVDIEDIRAFKRIVKRFRNKLPANELPANKLPANELPVISESLRDYASGDYSFMRYLANLKTGVRLSRPLTRHFDIYDMESCLPLEEYISVVAAITKRP